MRYLIIFVLLFTSQTFANSRCDSLVTTTIVQDILHVSLLDRGMKINYELTAITDNGTKSGLRSCSAVAVFVNPRDGRVFLIPVDYTVLNTQSQGAIVRVTLQPTADYEQRQFWQMIEMANDLRNMEKR